MTTVAGIYIYDMARALKEFVAHAVKGAGDFGSIHDHTSLRHLNSMLCDIITGRVTGEPAKCGIGYVQGALVAKGHLTHAGIDEIHSKLGKEGK